MEKIRPEFNQLNLYGGHVFCSCGMRLQTVNDTYKHWELGHFDITKNIDA